MSYIYKRIVKLNLQDIISLYKSCFGVLVTIDELERKFDTKRFGEEYLGFVAVDENKRIGGYYGVFPCRFSYEGQELLAGQSGDTMTAPDHRKKGLFSDLANETYTLCEKIDVAFVFGFPNENSLPGFERKLNWNFYGNMKMFTIKNNVHLPLCEIASKYSFFKKMYRKLILMRVKNQLVELERFNFKSESNGVLKNQDFFNYKLSKSKDTYLLNCEGFKLIIKTEPHLMIGDVEKFDKSRIKDFLLMLNKLSKLTLAIKTQLILSENHWLFALLENQISSTQSLPIGFYEINKDIDYSMFSFSLADYDTF